jgi:hypothetical protein
LTRKYLDFIIWQEVLNLMGQKEHLTFEGVLKTRRVFRSLQHLHRQQVHSTVIDQVLSIRPHWRDSLLLALKST